MQSIGGVGVDKMNWGKAQVRVFKKRNTENRRNNVHYKLRRINMVHLGAKNWKKLNENLYLEELTSLPSIEQAELSSQMSPSRKDTDVFFSLEIQWPQIKKKRCHLRDCSRTSIVPFTPKNVKSCFKRNLPLEELMLSFLKQ